MRTKSTDAARQSPLVSALEEVTKLLSDQYSDLQQLEGKLNPVLVPRSEPATANIPVDPQEVPMQPLSEVDLQITNIKRILSVNTELINSIYKRSSI